tara:strand:- start:6762 stop:7058 length:297 start_codon:yes stop_codon:yes gene_type:complete
MAIPTTEALAHMNNLQVHCGTATFTTSGTTVAVSTHLSRVVSGIVTPNAVTADAETHSAETGYVADMTTPGSVTISRVVETGGTITSGGVVNFMFFGF